MSHETPEEQPTKIRVYLTGGQTIETYSTTIDSLDELEDAINDGGGRPEYREIGDALVFSRAIAAAELA